MPKLRIPDWLKTASTVLGIVIGTLVVMGNMRTADLRAQNAIDSIQTKAIAALQAQGEKRDTAIEKLTTVANQTKRTAEDGKKLSLLIAKALGISELQIQAATMSTDTTADTVGGN